MELLRKLTRGCFPDSPKKGRKWKLNQITEVRIFLMLLVLYPRFSLSTLSSWSMALLEGGEANMSGECLEQCFEARIAGLDPINFITLATPHLGSRGHKQFPLLCGLPFLERSASQTAHWIAGRSGKHLFLTDDDNGKPPLLLRMVDDSDDLKFMSALRSFKCRVAYANANYDHVVGWRTSSICREHELPKSYLLVKNEKYPHIVHVDQGNTRGNNSKTLSMVGTEVIDLEEALLKYPGNALMLAFRKAHSDMLHTIQFRQLLNLINMLMVVVCAVSQPNELIIPASLVFWAF